MKAFVTRYRGLLANVKKQTDTAVIVVPNVGTENQTTPVNERTLGSDVDSVIRKVFELNRQGRAYLATKAIFASAKTLAEQFALVTELAKSTPTLRPVLNELHSMPRVVSLHIYVFTHATATYIVRLSDNVVRLNEKNSTGLGKALGDKKRSPVDFPKFTQDPVPAGVKANALVLLDDLSTSLPQKNILKDGDKKSAGGWQIWSSNKEGVYVAFLYALTTMEIPSRRVVDAIVGVFTQKGIKACVQGNRDTGKYAVTVAFNLTQLQEVNFAELKQLLQAEIKTYTYKEGVTFVGSSTVNSPVHTSLQSTVGVSTFKPEAAGDRKRLEKK